MKRIVVVVEDDKVAAVWAGLLSATEVVSCSIETIKEELPAQKRAARKYKHVDSSETALAKLQRHFAGRPWFKMQEAQVFIAKEGYASSTANSTLSAARKDGKAEVDEQGRWSFKS